MSKCTKCDAVGTIDNIIYDGLCADCNPRVYLYKFAETVSSKQLQNKLSYDSFNMYSDWIEENKERLNEGEEPISEANFMLIYTLIKQIING